MKKLHRLAYLLALIPLLVACPDDSSSSEDTMMGVDSSATDTTESDGGADTQTGTDTITDPNALAYDDFPAAASSGLCSLVFTCCSAEEIEAIANIPNLSEELCAALIASDLEDEDQAAAIQAGRLLYDPILAKTCVDTTTAATCEGVPEVLENLEAVPACATFISPGVELGGDCETDSECIGDSHCVGSLDNGNAAGTCTARPGDGEACDLIPKCIEGFHCEADVCVADVALGQSCEGANVCVEGAFCKGFAASPDVGTCASTGAVADGEACEDDIECMSGSCADSLCEAAEIACNEE